jgi:histidinol-phosphate/aromatic aminotransferase/cobyric acid decarboxylase-like protein
MSSQTVALVLVGVAVLSLLRIVMQWRGVARKHVADWDEQFIQQLRKAGVSAFEDQVVDFFFTVPDTRGSDAIGRLLRAEGYIVDARPDPDSGRISVHAQRTMRLHIQEMQSLTARFRALAAEHGGTYDNWAVGKPR